MESIRKISILVFAFCIVSAVGCKKDDGFKDASDITGTWTLIGIKNIADIPDIVVTFEPDGGFELVQQIMEGRHETFTGTYVLSGGVLSGEYSDGSALESYRAAKKDDLLRLTSVSNPQYVCTYSK